MKKSKHIVILLFLLLPLCIFAQSANKTAEDYFNAASEKYINNNTVEALKLIYQGLQLDKDNKKLQDLAEIILKKDKNKSQQNKQKQQQQQQQLQKQQQQQNKSQQQQEKKQGEQQKQQKQGMKKEDAERMLEAMKNKEKQTQDKLNRQQEGKRSNVEKDW